MLFWLIDNTTQFIIVNGGESYINPLLQKYLMTRTCNDYMYAGHPNFSLSGFIYCGF
jgi:hypothetical protein